MNRCDPVTDLSEAFQALVRGAYAPEGPSPSEAGDTGDERPDGAAEDGGVTDDDDDGQEDDATDDGQPSRVKVLSDEAAKWRRKFREADTRIKALEDGQAGEDLKAENRTLHLRLAWERATSTARLIDTEAAWRLSADDLTGVEIKDGKVDATRISEIVNHVVERYPYLVEADEPDPGVTHADAFPNMTPSGRRTDGKSRTTGGLDQAVLARKFPALRR